MLGLFLEAQGCPLPQYSKSKSASALSRFLNIYDCLYLAPEKLNVKIKIKYDFTHSFKFRLLLTPLVHVLVVYPDRCEMSVNGKVKWQFVTYTAPLEAFICLLERRVSLLL